MKKLLIGVVAVGVLAVGALAITWVGIAAIGADAATVPTCSANSLDIDVGQSDGTAGTVYYPVVFTNVGAKTCSVRGWPQVAFSKNDNWGGVFSHGAISVNHGVKGYGDTVVLHHGASASAALGVVDTGNWTKAMCEPVVSRSIRVTFDRKIFWVEKVLSVCSARSSATISGVVAGRSGIS